MLRRVVPFEHIPMDGKSDTKSINAEGALLEPFPYQISASPESCNLLSNHHVRLPLHPNYPQSRLSLLHLRRYGACSPRHKQISLHRGTRETPFANRCVHGFTIPLPRWNIHRLWRSGSLDSVQYSRLLDTPQDSSGCYDAGWRWTSRVCCCVWMEAHVDEAGYH